MKKGLLAAVAGAVMVAVVLAAAFTLPQNQVKTPVLTLTSQAQVGLFVAEYPTQSADTAPNGIAVDSHGSVWFMLQALGALAQLNPANGTLREYQLPSSTSRGALTWGVVVDDSRGLVWFTEQQSNAVWSFSIASSKFTQHSLPFPNSFPFGIAIDKQGNVWFTEIGVAKIGEVMATGSLSEYNVPLGLNSRPAGITVDGSGTVWFTLSGANEIGSLRSGKFQLYDLSGLVESPVGIAADASGNLWMTQHGPSLVSEFNPQTRHFRSVSTSIPPLNTSLPYFDYIDPSGNIWFNEHYGNSIARFDPRSSTMTEFEVPTRVSSSQNIGGTITMNLSPDGTPWFTEYFAGKVGRVNVGVPVPLDLAIQGGSGMQGNAIELQSNGSVTLSLSVASPASTRANFVTAVGNLTQNFHFAFSYSRSSGSGNFESGITITSRGSAPGIYFVTIGVSDGNIVVSKVVQVRIP